MVFVGVFVRPSSFAPSRFRANECPFVPGAGTLAFAIRSGVNLILLLARIQRIRNVPRFVLRSVLERPRLN